MSAEKLQNAELRPPPVEGSIAEAVFTTQILDRHTDLRLAEKADVLLLREPLFHARSLSGKRTLLR